MSDRPSSATAAPAGARALLEPPADFVCRHVGPAEAERAEMLKSLGVASLDALVAETEVASATLRTIIQASPCGSLLMVSGLPVRAAFTSRTSPATGE